MYYATYIMDGSAPLTMTQSKYLCYVISPVLNSVFVSNTLCKALQLVSSGLTIINLRRLNLGNLRNAKIRVSSDH